MLAVLSGSAWGQERALPPLPRTNFGTIGLIEAPSARMAPDGELSSGAAFFRNTQRYNLGFQILPWLEGSFRYSGLSHFDASYPVYWDRSFGIKARLWNEGSLLPAFAVGINDIVGTGIYSTEYIVASKQFGPVDATIGMGWGRLGSANTFRNPLTLLSHRFDNRPSFTTPGGTNFDVYFHGPKAGVFGGLIWSTPLKGVSLIAEASSDDYTVERVRNNFTPKTQMNYGVSWQASEGITLGLNWLYGRAIGGNLSFQMNPTRPQFPVNLGEPVPAPVIRTHEAQQNALKTMLVQRDPATAARRARALARTKDKNAFVDSLLRDAQVSNVNVTGHTLVLTTATGEPQRLCQAAAGIAAKYTSGISDIRIHQDGQVAARCGIPELARARFLDEASPAESVPILLRTPLATIDASTVDTPADFPAALRKFKADAGKQRITIEAVSFDASEATVYYTNGRYLSEAEAIERLARLLMADAPLSIEKFRLIAVRSSVPQQEYTVLRAPAERALSLENDDISVFDSPVSLASAPMNNPVLSAAQKTALPRFDWSVYPQFRQQFFDPTNPFGVQLVGALEASVEIAPGLALWGAVETSFYDNFVTNRKSDSDLPHVRTDFVEYFSKGKNGLNALQLNYRTRLSPEVFTTFRAGYLESMFAGVGGEVLWRPEGQRWALGADLYQLWQRNFDRLFGLQSYKVTTGHVTLYYSSPWYGLDFQVRAGQYLAGDRGLTFQVTRRFSTGVEIGTFFTKTNVSSARFGEGSFDKGIIIRIPLGWVAPINTQNMVALDLRPVQRDGGQVMLGDATLYDETRRASESEFVRHGARFAD